MMTLDESSITGITATDYRNNPRRRGAPSMAVTRQPVLIRSGRPARFAYLSVGAYRQIWRVIWNCHRSALRL